MKNEAGTSGWSVPISQSQTTVFVGQWMEWDSLPPCSIRKGEERKKKQEKFYIYLDVTHTQTQTQTQTHTHTCIKTQGAGNLGITFGGGADDALWGHIPLGRIRLWRRIVTTHYPLTMHYALTMHYPLTTDCDNTFPDDALPLWQHITPLTTHFWQHLMARYPFDGAVYPLTIIVTTHFLTPHAVLAHCHIVDWRRIATPHSLAPYYPVTTRYPHSLTPHFSVTTRCPLTIHCDCTLPSNNILTKHCPCWKSLGPLLRFNREGLIGPIVQKYRAS